MYTLEKLATLVIHERLSERSVRSRSLFVLFALGAVCAALPTTVFGQDVPLSAFQTFEGRVNETLAGGTLRSQPNNGGGTDPACQLNPTSSGTLTLPSGVTVDAAYLYWSGSGSTIDNSVTFNGSTVNATRTFTGTYNNGGTLMTWFQGFADVTTQVAGTGSGSYTLGGLTVDQTGIYCTSSAVLAGWVLHVFYTDPTIVEFRRIGIWDGFDVLRTTSGSISTTVTLSGLNIQAPVDGTMTNVVWEGDDTITSTNEFVRVNSTTLQSGDPFGSTSDNTSVSPSYGVDIDRRNLSSAVTAGQTSANLTVSTSTDLIILSTIVANIKSNLDPRVSKSFEPAVIPQNGTALMVFDVTNPNIAPLSGLTFTDALSGFNLASATLDPSSTCTGVTSNAVVGGTSFNVLSGNIAAESTCRIAIAVTSNTVGTHSNQITNLDTAETPTPVASNTATLTVQLPRIGAAKNAGTIVDNGDGTFTAPVTVEIENFGTESLFDLALVDDLTAFGTYNGSTALAAGQYSVSAPTVSGTSGGAILSTSNASFDGSGDTDLILTSSGDILPPGATATLQFSITFFPAAGQSSYTNQVTASGDVIEDGTADGHTSDLSTDGTDADGADNDGNPDEAVPTPIVAPIAPVIGAAKQAGVVTDNGDGTFTVPFTVVVENFGNAPLYDIQVSDLLAAFGSYNGATALSQGEYSVSAPTIGSLTGGAALANPNAGFDGEVDANLVSVTAGDILPIGATAAINFSVTFFPAAGVSSFANQANASGDLTENGTSDGDATDQSTDGADPDGTDADDNPDEAVATPVSVNLNPVIGSAKDAGAVVDNGDGTFTVPFTITLENFGSAPLYDIQITDDLSSFGSFLAAGALSPGEYRVSAPTIGTLTGGALVASTNGSFDGESDGDLVSVTSGDILPIGATAQIGFSVTFFPAAGVSNFANQATASGDLSENGTADGDATDLSTDGADPDGVDGDGNPDESVATPVTVSFAPVIGAAKAAGTVVDNGDGTFTVPFTVVVENFGNAPLFDLQVSDDLSSFGSFNGTPPLAQGEYSVSSMSIGTLSGGANLGAVNASFDGSSDQRLVQHTSGDVLPIGATASINFSLTFVPDAGVSSFSNQAVASGDIVEDGNEDGDATDTSTDGTDPDGSDNDDTPDESSTTPVSVTLIPGLGVAKEAGSVVDNGDGTFTVPFTVVVENFGNVPLFDLRLSDILNSFGTYNAAPTLSQGDYDVTTPVIGTLTGGAAIASANAGFNGDTDTDLISLTSGDVLPVSATAAISFSVTFFPSAGISSFSNQATGSGDVAENGVADSDVTDLSTDGADPDGSDNDDNPDEATPTPVTISLTPVIGAAKQAGAVTDNGDGTFTVPFTVVVENFGNVPLFDIQVSDDVTGFGTFNGSTALSQGEYTVGTVTVGSLTGGAVVGSANAGFDGSADQALITLSAGDVLPIGATAQLGFNVTFFPSAGLSSFVNQAIASGDETEDGTADGDATDVSTDGSDPDGTDNDDTPDESVATPVSVSLAPQIGSSKSAGGVTDNGDGTFTVPFVVAVENFGNTPLYDLQVSDNLASFGAYNGVSALGPGQYTVSAPAIGGLTGGTVLASANPTFDGSSDLNLLALSPGDVLPIGGTGQISFSVTFFPAAGNTSFANQATASGDTSEDGNPDGDTVDLSTDGNDPDGSDNDGNPDESTATPVTVTLNPVIGAAKQAGAVVDNSDGTFTVPFAVVVENFGNVPLHDVQVTDLLSSFGTFNGISALGPGQYNVTTPTVSGLSGGAVIASANSSYDGASDSDLLVVTAGDVLPIGATAQISFSVTFFPDAGASNFSNQANASADIVEDGNPDGDTTDLSTDGIDPDGSDGDDNPDESTATPVSVTLSPVIGAAKAAGAVVDNGDGSFTVPISILIENFGNAPLHDLQVTDNLSAFGSYNGVSALAQGEYAVSVPTVGTTTGGASISSANANFDGEGDQALLVVSAGDVLPVGSTAVVTFSVTFVPSAGNTSFVNQATGSGDLVENGVSDGDTTDLSTDGSDADGSDNDDNPDESVPTTITVSLSPVVGLAKQAGSVTDNGDGTFSVGFSIVAENFGNVPLYDLQLVDDLASFGSFNGPGPLAQGEYSVSVPVIGTLSGGAVVSGVNGVFDGSADHNLLAFTPGDVLPIGATAAVSFTVTFFPSAGATSFSNQAVATGDLTEDGNADGDTSDDSVDGTDPDGTDSDDNPDESGTTTVTVSLDPVIGVAKSAGAVVDNGDGTFAVPFTLTVENFGNVPLFDLALSDDLSAFGLFNGATALVQGEYAVSAPVLGTTTGGAVISGTNVAFDGAADQRIVVATGGDVLPVGATYQVSFTVTFNPSAGNTSYTNQVSAGGDVVENGSSDLDTQDLSTDGLDPDGTDGDDTPDESVPTTVTISLSPQIGAAKEAGAIVDNGDGSFTVPFSITIENFGNVPLFDLQVTDDLASFGSYNGTTTLSPGEYSVSAPVIGSLGGGAVLAAASAAFDGSGNQTLLVPTAGDVLPIGATAEVTFMVTFFPAGGATSFVNQASASGDVTEDSNPDGDTTDLSTDGADPDGSDADDNPDEATPTPVTITLGPSIGLAKQAGTVVDNGDGTFRVPFTMVVENFGNAPLYDLQISDDLTAFGTFNGSTALSAGEYTVAAPVVDGVTGGAVFTAVNGSFNGSADQRVLVAAGGDQLPVGATAQLSFDLVFFPSSGVSSYVNQAVGSGDVVENGTVDGDATDVSTDGADPDGTDGDDIPDESAPTPVTVTLSPIVGVAKEAGTVTDNGDGTFTIPFTLRVENFGNVALFDVQLSDNLGSFGTYNGSTALSPGQYSVTAPTIGSVSSGSVLANANSNFDGTSDSNLLVITAGDVLAIGGTANVQFSVTVFPSAGNTAFTNQAVGTGDLVENGVSDGDASDQSTDGADPDGNDNDDTPDENEVTNVSVSLAPVIGVAKRAGAVTDNGDGSFSVTFTITAENFGNAPLFDVQLTDDLSSFGSYNAGPTLAQGQYTVSSLSIGSQGGGTVLSAVNPAFDGETDQAILALTPGDVLPVGGTADASFVLTFIPPAGISAFSNQAAASGDLTENGAADGDATDLSTDGTDPDGTDGDDSPDENVPTPVSVSLAPVVGAAKQAGAVADNGDGTFTVPFSVAIENFGNAPLFDLQVTDDLASFGTYNGTTALSQGEYAVSSPSIAGLAGGTVLSSANASFDGSADTQLLVVTPGDVLPVGGTGQISFAVTFYPSGGASSFSNQAVASGDLTHDGNPDGDTTDLSTDGADPDGTDADDNPDEATPTPVSITLGPVIGAAKQAGAVTDNGDGTFTVPFTVTIENFGNAPLFDLQVSDDLASFGSFNGATALAQGEYVVSSGPVVGSLNGGAAIGAANTGYNGESDQELLLVSPGDVLPIGATAQIQFEITFYPTGGNTLFVNQAVASGDLVENGSSDGDATDNSTSGADPDGADGDDNPDEGDPTTVSITFGPSIGAAKQAGTVVDNGNGTFSVPFTVSIENFGNAPLFDIQVSDALTSFGSYNGTTALSQGEYSVTSPVVVGLSAGAILAGPNASFDGESVSELLVPTAGDVLPVSGTAQISFTVTFFPSAGNTSFVNQAIASGDLVEDGTPDGDATDLSTDGADPDGSDADGIPDESDPTPVSVAINPLVGAAKMAGPVVDNGDGSFTVPFSIVIENFGNAPLFDIQITDDLGSFGAFNGVGPLAPGEYVVSAPVILNATAGAVIGAINTSFDGESDMALLSLTAGDLLPIGATVTVDFGVTFFPAATVSSFVNQATVAGDLVENGTVDGDATDLSTDGTDPDGTDADGIPDEADPTPVSVSLTPVVGAAKLAGTPTDNGDGTFTIPFTITIENFGNAPLFDVQVTDDLSSFGSHNGTTPLSAGEYNVTAPTVSSLTGGAILSTGNAGFDGSIDQTLIALTGGDTLPIGSVAELSFAVTVFPPVGIDTFSNQATASADLTENGVADGDATDLSTNGSDPDGSDNDDNPDENTPTPVSVTLVPRIGVAKAAGAVVDNADGTFTVPFTIRIENYGNASLYDLRLADDLSSFGSFNGVGVLAQGEYRVSAPVVGAVSGGAVLATGNAGFDGSSDIDLVQQTAGDVLPIGGSIQVSFSVTMVPAAGVSNFLNQAVAYGDLTEDGSSDGDASDQSTDGADPDGSDADNNPDENLPTPVSVSLTPVIGSAKAAGPVTDNGDGTFTVPISIRIQNYGNVPLFDLQVSDDLASFGSFNGSTPLSPGQYTVGPPVIQSLVGGATIAAANAGYDGAGDPNVLTMTSGDVLPVGASADVAFDITFYPSGGATVFNNQALASGDVAENGVGDGDATDQSTDGADPDGTDADGIPDESEVTTITVSLGPVIGASKEAGAVTDNGDGSFTVPFTITVENFGNVSLYDLQIDDDLSSFGSWNGGTPLSQGEYRVSVPTIGASSGGAVVANADGSFDGATNTALLVQTAGDVLPIGATIQIGFQVTFVPSAGTSAFSNQATTYGDVVEDGSPDGDTIDASTDGADPDGGDGDGNPDEDVATPVTVILDPSLGAAKQAGTVVDNGDGTFSVPFTVVIENFGNVPLFDLQVADDLSSFGSFSSGVLSDGEYTVTAPAVLALNGGAVISAANPSFNGESDGQLLVVSNGDVLPVGSTAQIGFDVVFRPGGGQSAFVNQAVATGDLTEDGTSDGDATDQSTNGADPDGSDGDDNPDENDVTPVSITLLPSIGAAKSSGAVTDNGDGTFDVSFTIGIENFGNASLFDLSIADDLSAFGTFSGQATLLPGQYRVSAPTLTAASTGSVLTGLNANFDGTGNTAVVTPASGDVLPVGGTASVAFSVTFYPAAGATTFANQAAASADATEDGATSGDTSDLSTDGTDPDGSDGDDNPDEADPTIIVVTLDPVIGLAKQAGAVQYNGDGTFTVTYDIIVENFGNAALYDLTITDDLTAFGSPGSASALAQGEYSVSNLAVANASPGAVITTLNPSFDGSAVTNLVTPSTSAVLPVGGTATIRFVVTFFPTSATTAIPNQATGSADLVPNGATDGDTADLSTDGSDPDGATNDDTPSESDPTIITVDLTPIVGIAKRVAAVVDNGDGSFTADFVFRAQNYGNVPLFDIQITDALTQFGTFVQQTPIAGQYAVGSVELLGQSVGAIVAATSPNPGFDGDSDQALLSLVAGNRLGIGDWLELGVSVTFVPAAGVTEFLNTALVSADVIEDGTAGGDATDISTDGADPDGGDSDGNPDEQDPTRIADFVQAAIGVAKSAGTPVDNGDGTFTIPYTIRVENFGNVALYDIQITDDLTQFGAVGGSTLQPGEYRSSSPVISQVATGSVVTVANSQFDGSTDSALLALDPSHRLAVGGSFEMSLNVTVFPQAARTTYENSALGLGDIVGDGTTDADASDISTDGSDPDGTDDDNIPDEDDPTVVELDAQVVGIAKEVTQIRQTGSSEYEVDFLLTVENLGNVTATNLQVEDDLNATFPGAASISVVGTPDVGSLTLAASAFDGLQNRSLLAGGDALAVGASAVVRFTVAVDIGSASGPFFNTATVTTSTTPGGTVIATDASASGNDPDPNGDADPSEDDPTEIAISPQTIGIAKAVRDVRRIDASTFEVDFVLSVQNLSNSVTATNIQVVDDLTLSFPGVSSIEVAATPDVGRFSSPSVAFDGTANTMLLSGSDSLAPAERDSIRFTARIDLGAVTGPFTNQAVVTASAAPGGEVLFTDLSANGINPDQDGDGDPGSDGTSEDEPTPVPIVNDGVIAIEKSVDRPVASIGGFAAYDLVVTNQVDVRVEGIIIQDDPPASFAIADGSSFLVRAGPDGVLGSEDDQSVELSFAGTNPIRFDPIALDGGEVARIVYVMRIGATAAIGRHTNRAVPMLAGLPVGDESVASVDIVPNPDFELTGIIGKVFSDLNKNGVQDRDEPGIPGVRIATVRGLVVETDEFGRYHLAEAINPRWDRGSNLIVKVDPVTLPFDAAFTTENPRIVRATQGLSAQVDFGVWLPIPERPDYYVESEYLDIDTDVLFDYDSAELNAEAWPKLEDLANKIRAARASSSGIRALSGLVRADQYARPDTGATVQLTIVGHTEDRDLQPEEIRRHYTVRINFPVLEAKLYPGGKAELDSIIADWRNASDIKIVSSGHTSNLRIHPNARGIFKDNYELSNARAKAVADYLAEGLAVDSTRIKVVGYGPDHPIAPNNRPDGRALNRRTEIDITGMEISPALLDREGGSDEYDIELGARRASAVIDALRRLLPEFADDAAAEDVVTKSAGKSEPVVENGDEDGSAANRRASIAGRIRVDRRVDIPQGGTLWYTVDPAVVEPRLAMGTVPSIVVEDGLIRTPVRFAAYTNYGAFIDAFRIRIYKADDEDFVSPIAEISGPGTGLTTGIVWDGRTDAALTSGTDLVAVLRVIDDSGAFDETTPVRIALVDSDESSDDFDEPDQYNGIELHGKDNTRIRTISIAGETVRIFGSDVAPLDTLEISGNVIPVDMDGQFAVEQIVPPGDSVIPIHLRDGTGTGWNHEFTVHTKDQYFYLVGMADLTVGMNQSATIEPLSSDDRYDGDLFADGKVAFYLKGKIKGRYLITAQLETDEASLKDMLGSIDDQDPRRVFRNLDPDRYYPVYGDGSSTVSDVNTQGHFYVRVDWDESQALWGNFNASFTGTEFAEYNRSLYGARLAHASKLTLENGERRYSATGFASESRTAFAHDQFAATGGSLYYLRQTNIVQGSAKVWVETRDKDSGRVVDRRIMTAGADYEIDEIQGRLLLRAPLSQVAPQVAPSLIRDRPLDGNKVFLIVDYEYLSMQDGSGNWSYGGRAKAWATEQLGVGATYVQENRDAQDYQLMGADLTLRHKAGTFVKAEIAGSRANQSAQGLLSYDGGLTFQPLSNPATGDRSGLAYGVEARVNLSEVSTHEGQIAGWYKKRAAGFSTARLDTGVETTEFGAEALYRTKLGIEIGGRGATVDQDSLGRDEVYAIQATYDAGQIDASAELRHVSKRTLIRDSAADLAAIKLGYDLDTRTNVYGIGQATINRNDNYRKNNRFGVGLKTRLSDRLGVLLELGSGSRGESALATLDYRITDDLTLKGGGNLGGDGNGALAGADWQINDRHSLYGTYTLSTDVAEQSTGTLTVGQRSKLSNHLALFTEGQFSESSRRTGINRVYGLDFSPVKELSAGLSVQRSTTVDSTSGNPGRDALSVWAAYQARPVSASSKVEFRRDRGRVERNQWLTSNRVDVKITESAQLLSKLNLAQTTQAINDADVAHFVEGAIGLAYRPVRHNRLNLLAKAVYLSDLPSQDQRPARTDQESRIASIDAAFSPANQWQIGAKVAVRDGKIRPSRDVEEWIENDANLLVIQLRYHFVDSWDGVAEYRILWSRASQDKRNGIVAGLYRRLNRSMTLGLGYNFTGISDDLRGLNESSHGWFLNAIGSF